MIINASFEAEKQEVCQKGKRKLNQEQRLQEWQRRSKWEGHDKVDNRKVTNEIVDNKKFDNEMIRQ